MPNYRKLTLLVSLAACERSDTTTTPEPQFVDPPAPQPEARLEVAPAPIADVQPLPEPKPEKAAVAPVKPKVAKKAVAAKKPNPKLAPLTTGPFVPSEHELDRRCMSRAGCRWEREEMKLRVTKKKQQVEQRATPPESKQ